MKSLKRVRSHLPNQKIGHGGGLLQSLWIKGQLLMKVWCNLHRTVQSSRCRLSLSPGQRDLSVWHLNK